MQSARLFTPKLRTTGLLLGAAVVLIAAAAVIGVADNPPGIALLYLGIAMGLSAWAYRWRGPRNFLRLLFGAVIGFVLLVVLHNVGYAIASVTDTSWLRAVWEALEVSAFLLAVLVAPAAFVVGAVGAAVAFLAGRRGG